LSFPNLTGITGSTARRTWVRILADTGGTINMPALQLLSDPNAGDTACRSFLVDALGAGSKIDMHSLIGFEDRSSYTFDNNWPGPARLLADQGGTIRVGPLVPLASVRATVGTTASKIDGGLDMGLDTVLGGSGTVTGSVLSRFGLVNPGGASSPGRLTIN